MSEVAYALGGLVAAEALGVTNLTGGERDRDSPIAIPSGGGGLDGSDVAQIVESATPGDTSPSVSPAILAAIESGQNVPSEVSVDIPGDGSSGATDAIQDTIDKVAGGTDSGGNGGTDGGGFDLQDTANTKPGIQTEDLPAVVGESGKATGEAGNALGSTVNDVVQGTANIIGDPSKGLDNAGGIIGGSHQLGETTGRGLDKGANIVGKATDGLFEENKNSGNNGPLGGLFQG